MIKTNEKEGITLIALVITIIILLILAGITIISLAESGLLAKSGEAKERTIKAQLKEEIEMAIQEVQIEELPKGNNVTLESLAKGQLVAKLTEITTDLGTDKITGEYKDYDYIITGEYEVVIGNKLVGEKPTITHTVDTEQIGVTQVVITVNASVSDGTIVEIVKPDGSIEQNVGQATFTVNKSGKYVFTAKSSNGRRLSYTVKITNILPSAPVIESQEGYPILTIYGVQNTQGKVTIIYDDNEEFVNSYSEDNGTTWKEYTGSFEPMASTIIAKSAYREDPTIKVETTKKVVVDDAMPPEAYDSDLNTCAYATNKVIKLDNNLVGEKIELNIYCPAWGHVYVVFYKEDKITTVGDMGYWHTNYGRDYLVVNVPESAEYLKIVPAGRGDACYIYDIRLDDIPKGDVNDLYPYINSNGVHNRNKYKISYYKTAIKKLYSYDNENWSDYPEEGVSLGYGQTVYAKSVNEKGKESKVLVYTNSLLNIITNNAYDGDANSYYDCSAGVGTYIFNIDQSAQGKDTYVKFTARKYSEWHFTFYDSNGEIVETWPTVVAPWDEGYQDGNLTIPFGVARLEIQYKGGNGGSGTLYEINIIN